jgi:hypothetical protein
MWVTRKQQEEVESINTGNSDRGRGVRVYLWMTCFKIIDRHQFPLSLIDDLKCSGRIALLMNGHV